MNKVSLLDHKNENAILDLAAKITQTPLEPAAYRKGLEALLTRLTELDGEMRRERAGLDVPLREGLRLAAEWATLAEMKTKP